MGWKKYSFLSTDDKSASPPGSTILEAARLMGVKIPTLCYLADLTPEGSCRVCVVEVQGLRSLVTACTHPVSEGMVVWTSSAAVREGRRTVVEMLLANHPDRLSDLPKKYALRASAVGC